MDKMLSLEKWTDLQGKLKQKYPELTDADLQQEENGEQEMLRMVEYKLRKTKEEMAEIIGKL
jgi:uncharacterized protein YjbJ (UPF0337 family)